MATPATPDGVADWKRDALERVLNSRTLASRARLRQLLSFLGEAALAGRSDELKEQALAVSVFGRQIDQFTSDDNIVRVTVRQLRAKIEEYYLSEGKDDPWRIGIPRGAYVPLFREADDPQPATSVVSPPPLSGRPRSEWHIRIDWVIAVAIGALLAAAIFTIGGAREPVRKMTVLGLMQPSSGRRVLIVCADAAMQMYKAATGTAPTLAEYQQRHLLNFASTDPEEEKLFQWINNSQLFGTDNVAGVSKLIPAFPPGTVAVRHPRQVTDRDFIDDNVILLSGPFANPWAQLFEPKLTFQVTADPDGTAFIRNVHPRRGEQAAYSTTKQEGGGRRTYCRVAFLPNLSGRGKVLLIGGPTGAIELVSARLADDGFYQELRRVLAVPQSAPMPSFEVLVEATEVSRTAVSVRLACTRRLD